MTVTVVVHSNGNLIDYGSNIRIEKQNKPPYHWVMYEKIQVVNHVNPVSLTHTISSYVWVLKGSFLTKVTAETAAMALAS